MESDSDGPASPVGEANVQEDTMDQIPLAGRAGKQGEDSLNASRSAGASLTSSGDHLSALVKGLTQRQLEDDSPPPSLPAPAGTATGVRVNAGARDIEKEVWRVVGPFAGFRVEGSGYGVLAGLFLS